jgi:putative transposase
MGIDAKLIDQLLAEHGRRPEDIAGENGLLKQLTKALLERALEAEMTDHLGYEKHDAIGRHTGNSCNGRSRKKLKGDAARSQRFVRAKDHCQAPDPFYGVRR